MSRAAKRLLGPVTPEEEAAQEALYAELAAQQSAARTMTMNGLMDEVDNCMTGGPVYLTNVTATVMDDQTVMVSFDIAGGTNGVAYDIYTTTNLADNPITTQWTWLGQGYTCNSYTFTNQPFDEAFYALATPQETMVVAWGDNIFRPVRRAVGINQRDCGGGRWQISVVALRKPTAR